MDDIDSCYKDELWKLCDKGKKPDVKGCILYELIYVKYSDTVGKSVDTEN